jgi:hypothetical protein
MTSLEFKLTTRFNPENLGRKLRKDWLSKCHRYRIVWRKQFMGVDLLPRYFAMRLNKRPDGDTFWDFALDRERRPYKTFKRAYQACCKAAGIVLEEETKPKRRKRIPKKVEPIEAVAGAQLLLPPTSAPILQPKRRGRPKVSKNKVKNG